MATDQAQSIEKSRYRRELLPSTVDHLAHVKPDAFYAEYPVSSLTYEEGYRQITYGNLSNVVNGLAWWLWETLGQGGNFEMLTYIGPNDLRYPALILGAVKAGYVIFLTSPRNSITAQVNLLNRLKCTTILSPSPQPPAVTAIIEAQKLRVLEVPGMEDLLNKQYPPFQFHKTYEEAHSEPLFAVHTSGSTGLPKPLIYTHETGAANMTLMSLDPPLGWESQHRVDQGKRVFLTFPPFHGAYLVSHLFNAIPFGTIMIAPISGAITSAKGLVEGLKRTPANVAFLVPSIVQELSQSPELLNYCAKNLEKIIYCGGDLPQVVGDAIASKIKLLNQYGASEIGLTTQLQPKSNWDPKDWKYVKFHPEMGAELRHITDDRYELYILRAQNQIDQQPTFTLFPHLKEYPSRDLFVRHPSKDKSDLWSWRARADDIIVFLNGEKTNPISMEQHIASCNSEIAAVLVIGAQRFQAALLVEPVTERQLSSSDRAAFIEKIWPSIEEANRDCPSHARITKSHVFFTQPRKPMLRAGKGTVQRAGTLRLYEKELDAFYTDADTMSTPIGSEVSSYSGSLDDLSAVSRFIKNAIASVTNWTEFDNADNIFALGMDSLQALMVVRKLRQSQAMATIELSTIYTNPSVHELAGAVLCLSKQHKLSKITEEQGRQKTRSSTLKEYTDLIDQIPLTPRPSTEAKNHSVILTGSTGALGSYILHALLAKPAVAHVHCLNRATDGFSLQTKRNQSRDLPTQLDSSRVTFLTVDLSHTHFGLRAETYGKLLHQTTHVIHSAWPVNFNISLANFAPQFMGLVNLIKFTASAVSSPHFLFISSISSVQSYRTASLRTPEEVVVSDSAPGPYAYAESKYVSEHLLSYAIQRLPIDVSFARVGQIAGAANFAGLWNRAEWFPSLVISSHHVGSIPESLGLNLDKINWVPVDLLAEVLVELTLSQDQLDPNALSGAYVKNRKPPHGRLRVWHPLNLYSTNWDEVQIVVADELRALTGKQLETVALGTWIDKIRTDAEAKSGPGKELQKAEFEAYLDLNPAVKLLTFYNSMLLEGGKGNELETKKTEKKSTLLRAIAGVNARWIRKWVREFFRK